MRPSLRVLRALPKADLHSHIDGSVPIRELFQIARRHRRRILTPKGAELDSVSSFMRYVVGAGYGSMLDNIVDRFYPTTGLMQTDETIRDVGISYVEAQKEDGVAYVEGRFAPQYHTREGLSLKDVIVNMAEGLAEGGERYGVKTNLIVGIGREAPPGTGVEVARAASSSGLVVAVDLCGPEAGNPSHKFGEAFEIAKASGLKVTVHAGEGAESKKQNLLNMEEAITQLGADRLGHAIPLSRSRHLLELVKEKSIGIEMNPVSNLVLGNIGDLRELAIDRLLNLGIEVSVNSDDPSLWPKGNLSDVYFRVCMTYGFGFEELGRLVQNSFASSFASNKEKKRLAQMYRDARERTGLDS
jgi:adenosine deaminase